MSSKETRFSYVYKSLKCRITEGLLLPGSRLPSSRVLKDEYQVSLFTINKVLAALRKEGLIELEPRRAARVCRLENERTFSASVEAILSQKDFLLQLYQTMELVLPPLLTFASHGCKLEAMPHYRQVMKVKKNGDRAGGWRPVSGFLCDVLRNGGGELPVDLYTALELQGRLGFFVDKQEAYTGYSLKKYFSQSDVFIRILNVSDNRKKYFELCRLYQALHAEIRTGLDQLAHTLPSLPLQTETTFSWNPNRGREYRYMHIVQDLEIKIGTGIYPVGSYLPHEAELAQLYQVSVSTVRSALAILEQRTFTKTLNVKGTIVQTPNLDALSPFTDKSTRQAAIRYLRALQFSSLIMEPISYYAADLLQPADFIQLERRFAVPQSILLNDIIETMMQRIGLPPLLVIMTEARRMTDWGYFLAFYKNKRQTIAELNEKSLLAYQYLCKDDKKAFAHAVASCYHDILDSVRKQLATYFHLAEADSILTPPFLFT